MPYIEGESLHDKLRRERQLPVEEALRIAREVTEALAHAHGKKIVHRDIKPANIMLSGRPRAGRGLRHRAGGGSEPAAHRLPGPGLAVGTPQYMSPEQASGSPDLDARSDIYSVGAMLYEMLVGEPPFTGPTAAAIVIRSLTEPHRQLTRAREGISPIIDELVDRALAKNAADRWQTASDFAHALNATGEQLRYAPISGAQTPPAIAAVSSGRSSRKVWSLVAITATLVLALVLGLVYRAKAAASSKHSVVRLAVLPFENRGAAEDGYFVDGVADQVRGKLTSVEGFEVIARASSNQYRESKKTLREVGRELEVDYLLTSDGALGQDRGRQGSRSRDPGADRRENRGKQVATEFRRGTDRHLRGPGNDCGTGGRCAQRGACTERTASPGGTADEEPRSL
jgi:serine/threonine-protein kinase